MPPPDITYLSQLDSLRSWPEAGQERYESYVILLQSRCPLISRRRSDKPRRNLGSRLLRDLPTAGSTADINLDGLTTIEDWATFSAHAYADLTSFTRREKFQRGDVDLDGDNDLADFRLFKNLFDAANGVNAFARLVEGVPEPASLPILAMAAVAASINRRRQR